MLKALIEYPGCGNKSSFAKSMGWRGDTPAVEELTKSLGCRVFTATCQYKLFGMETRQTGEGLIKYPGCRIPTATYPW